MKKFYYGRREMKVVNQKEEKKQANYLEINHISAE